LLSLCYTDSFWPEAEHCCAACVVRTAVRSAISLRPRAQRHETTCNHVPTPVPQQVYLQVSFKPARASFLPRCCPNELSATARALLCCLRGEDCSAPCMAFRASGAEACGRLQPCYHATQRHVGVNRPSWPAMMPWRTLLVDQTLQMLQLSHERYHCQVRTIR